MNMSMLMLMFITITGKNVLFMFSCQLHIDICLCYYLVLCINTKEMKWDNVIINLFTFCVSFKFYENIFVAASMINVLSIIEWLYLIIFESLIIFYSSHKVSHIVIWEYLINISVNT
jgi:hypothetical protein